MIRALIYDLDNTIYPVASIGDELFIDLFRMIEEEGLPSHQVAEIRQDIMRQPFQRVAEAHGFGSELLEKGMAHLRNLEVSQVMQPFPDFQLALAIPGERLLVTTGFTKMQWSKIRQLQLERFFKELYVVDPDLTSDTKKDVFQQIMIHHQFAASELLVVGDDPQSELKAGRELGIKTVCYNSSANRHEESGADFHISNYSELEAIVNSL